MRRESDGYRFAPPILRLLSYPTLFPLHGVYFNWQPKIAKGKLLAQSLGAMMDLYLDWLESVLLSRSKRTGSYELDFSEIPDAAGIYVFARGHGKAIEALYVGKAANLRSRIRQQLNNHRLMIHLDRAKNGVRGVIVAKWRARPGQRPEKCLALIERSLVRHFVLKGDDLVNKNGVSLRRQTVTSRARIRGFLPLRIYSDRD